MPKIIDLAAYRTQGTLVFAGRDRGRLVRAKAALEEADREPAPVEIRIPDDIFSITSSFFLGMFGPSIQRLGAENFAKHYLFVGKDISPIVRDGVREALRTGSPL